MKTTHENNAHYPHFINALILMLYIALFHGDGLAKRNIDNLDMMSGLSHGDVMSITQDPMGYVWVATANGLNRFDGQRFININSNNSGLGSNALNCVTQLDSDPERLWIATQRDGIFYYEHSTGEVKRPQGIPFTTTDVTTITPASDGGMWVNHYHYGPQYFNPLTGETRSYTFDKVEGLPKISWATAEGRDGKLYVGHAGEGFSVIDTLTRKATNHRHIEGFPSIPGDEVYAVCTDRNGNVWLGTDRGAAVYLPESGKTIPFVNNPSQPESIIPGRIRYITQTSSGEIWFASTLAGVCVLDPVYAKEENLGNARFKAIPTTGHGSGTSNAYARTIFEDSFGNVWIGNYRTGVDIVNHLSPGITRVGYTEGENSNSSYLPTWCCEFAPGNILWGGGENEIVSIRDGVARRIPLPQTAEESKTFVKALKAGTNGDLWIGTYDRGAMVYYPGDGVFRSVSGVNPDVKTFARNGNGDMLIGTDKGVYLCPNGSLVARYYEEVNRALKDLVIQTLLFDSQGKLWVGTFGKGIHVFNPDISPAGHIEKRSGLPSNAVTCISEDSRGRIWIGTREGLVVVPDLSKPESLKNVTGNDRRDSIHIASLETDGDCNVWASTNAGILRIGPDYDCVMAYPFRSSSGSLPLHTFMDNASAKDNDGRIFFASGNGIFEVEPKTLLATTDPMPVFVTGFEVIKDRHSRENKYSLPVASKKIVLPYDDNTFNISFNILDHALANSTEFAYKMEGDDNVWIYPAGNMALYRNLPPGTYKFMVRQRRNGQEWSDPQTILTIDIKPPFWLTWWAKSLYVIIILALMYAGFVFWNNRMKLKQQILTLEEKSRDRQKLNEERLKFYTNITHELRTPLTLILGPLEDMVSDPGMPPQYSSRLNMIRNSSTNLLNLINSILEFRQTETQNRLLRVGEGNLGNLVREIGLNYKELNSNPDVEIILDICDDGADMLFDASIVTTIVNNLMTNALKYTASGYVRLSCQSVGDNGSEWAEIKVADTGYGISPEGLEHIFERYYQVNDSHQASGTGIGLALVKSLVELHEAEIDVLSAPGKGSVFTVRLRKGNSYPGALRGNDGSGLRNDNGLPRPDSRVPSRPKVLVVEDNHDLRSYISKVLERDFDVICAKNGLEGLESVHSDNPDIIITDIMMPEMDGITMCRQIKDDIVTSHIPVIMLTAKDSSADKQEGYEAGAASYLTKPFTAKLLLARVNNIMRLQRKLAEHLRAQANRQFPQNAGADSNGQNESGEPQQKIGEAEKNQILSPLDRQFVDKIISIINDNIANPDLGVAFLADKMCMSNSTLYRKVIAILGMSTNEYVRGIRMERAREMLEEGLYPITEVAYRCGFSSHSSFAKSFKKHFGMSASEYVSAAKERPGGKPADPPAFS